MAVTGPRDDFLGNNDHFMAAAVLAGKRSRDPSTQVGACIEKDGKLVSIGYNDMPVDNKRFPWGKKPGTTEHKYLYVCHAELNAIMNAERADVKGGTMYVTLFPCNECAKLIIKAGLKEVVYLCDKYKSQVEFQASRISLDTADVPHRRFLPERTPTIITLEIGYNEEISQ
ncbi:deoxycytidylate deaminase-like [Gadus macrocephalus]|uniref:deoxycytidylate deaminase-like n=1 Tax=Gadus macrocephalus TaxID=80720 RepID=UPI0028CBB3A3|nr:deoxycytidylate deaminase-like [Gadus macrocephalus]